MRSSVSDHEQIYRDRCNNADEKAKWESSGLVRIDSLRRRTPFEDIAGRFWRFDHKVNNNSVCVQSLDGEFQDFFCASALVRPVSREEVEEILNDTERRALGKQADS